MIVVESKFENYVLAVLERTKDERSFAKEIQANKRGWENSMETWPMRVENCKVGGRKIEVLSLTAQRRKAAPSHLRHVTQTICAQGNKVWNIDWLLPFVAIHHGLLLCSLMLYVPKLAISRANRHHAGDFHATPYPQSKDRVMHRTDFYSTFLVDAFFGVLGFVTLLALILQISNSSPKLQVTLSYLGARGEVSFEIVPSAYFFLVRFQIARAVDPLA